jgi:hypothetical protein
MAYLATIPAYAAVPQATMTILSTARSGVLGDAQLVEDELAVVLGAPEQGVGDRVRLLVDLLGHERRVAALLGGAASQSTW